MVRNTKVVFIFVIGRNLAIQSSNSPKPVSAAQFYPGEPKSSTDSNYKQEHKKWLDIKKKKTRI